jgi:cysteine desulfurase/selenocysteine lyase
VSLDQDVRALFPQLSEQVRGRRLVYLDSAATSLKVKPVIDAMVAHMSSGASNVHRGAHYLSDRATELFEETRELSAQHVGADSKAQIVFTKGTTEGLNLIAHSLGPLVLGEGDEILLSQMEHHSNIVPWQLLAERQKAKVRFVPVLEDGSLDFATYQQMLSSKTKIVSLVHLSNALGTLNPIRKFFDLAHSHGAVSVLDAAQSAAVYPLNVADLGADFLVFSGHKLFGPTGVGVLYGRKDLLQKMPPYQGGGSMIAEVREESVSFLPPPHRFEAGTPPIAEVIGLGAALKFIKSLGFAAIANHEQRLMQAAEAESAKLPELRRIGLAPQHSHVFSFLLGNAHPSDVGAILDEQGVAVRAGHHCCQPLMRRFGIPGTVRASFSVYTSEQDVIDLFQSLAKAKELLL